MPGFRLQLTPCGALLSQCAHVSAVWSKVVFQKQAFCSPEVAQSTTSKSLAAGLMAAVRMRRKLLMQLSFASNVASAAVVLAETLADMHETPANAHDCAGRHV